MGSNVTFQSRNVLSKKLMTKGEQLSGWAGLPERTPALDACSASCVVQHGGCLRLMSLSAAHRVPCCLRPLPACAGKGALDSINTFSIITILSFLLLTPIALLTDGLVWTPAALAAAGVDSSLLAKRALLSAFAFHAYQQASRSLRFRGHNLLLSSASAAPAPVLL